MNESITAGPAPGREASPAEALPRVAKMPVPMMAPTPRAMRFQGPSVFLRLASPRSASPRMASIALVRRSWRRATRVPTIQQKAAKELRRHMPRRRPLRDPVTMHLDGQAVVAERGEPVAVALIAAGNHALARSPKFHRPRGPACLRAACDGCLARVDDEPNIMTCRVPAADGMRIEAQNVMSVMGSKDTDLLRVADWFFPDGMKHHALFAAVP